MEFRLTFPLPMDDVAAIKAAVASSTVLLLHGDGGNGSGVLVEIEDRFFVFTAAHCVEDELPRITIAEKAEGVGLEAVELSVKRGGAAALLCDDGVDAAVVEVAESSHGKAWLSQRAVQSDAIVAATIDELSVGPLPLVLSGMPAVQSSNLLLGQRRHVGLQAETTVAVEAVDRSLPFLLPCQTSETASDPGNGEVVETPNFAGMSGGGTWIATGGKAFLVGTHQSRRDLSSGSRRKKTFAFTTLISAHLAVLAKAQPELSGAICSMWPAVSNVFENRSASM